jgi:hypothetical protein
MKKSVSFCQVVWIQGFILLFIYFYMYKYRYTSIHLHVSA